MPTLAKRHEKAPDKWTELTTSLFPHHHFCCYRCSSLSGACQEDGLEAFLLSSSLCGIHKVPEVRRDHDGHLFSDNQLVTVGELCLMVGRLTGQHGTCTMGTGVCVTGHTRTFLLGAVLQKQHSVVAQRAEHRKRSSIQKLSIFELV